MRIPEALRHLLGPLELIHEQAGPRLLGLARAGIFALWIIKLLLDPIPRLADFPREFFQPVGLLALIPPSAWDHHLLRDDALGFFAFTLLFTLIVTIVSPLFVTITPRLSAVFLTASAILLTLYSSLIRSFGPAVHTDIALLLATYALAGFAWADLTAPQRARASYPLVTIAAILCLTYSLVGLNRAVAGGISVFTSDTMETWAIDASLRGYYFNTNVGWHVPQWPIAVMMLRGGLPVITLFEITAPLCLAWPRYRLLFIPVMLSFHLLSLVFMNIFFFDDMLLYLLLIDWSRRFLWLRA